MPLNPYRHICSVGGPHLWDQWLSLQCPAVTPPCESAAYAHPVLLSSLRPFWHFPASWCQAGEGKLGQWPGLFSHLVLLSCLAEQPWMAGQGTAPQAWPGVGWALLAGFCTPPLMTSFSTDGQQEATHGPRLRALRHSELRPFLSWLASTRCDKNRPCYLVWPTIKPLL